MATSPKKQIRTLQPLDTGDDTFHAPTSFVWTTIIIVFVASLLPWRTWEESPDLLLVVLAFWCAHSARGVGLVAAFTFGLLMDVHDTNVLGRHALYYVLVLYAVISMRRHMVQFSVLTHFIFMLPFFVLAAIPGRIFEAWLAGVWAGWGWLWSGLFTACLWFGVDLLFKFFSRPPVDENHLD